MMDERLRMVGLAFKAGKLSAGDAAVSEAVFAKRVRLICAAEDASERVIDRAELMPERCNGLFAKVPFTKQELGAALGLKECGIIAFLDPGLAWAFGKKLVEIDHARYSALEVELLSRKERAQRRKTKKYGGGSVRGGTKSWKQPSSKQARGGRKHGS